VGECGLHSSEGSSLLECDAVSLGDSSQRFVMSFPITFQGNQCKKKPSASDTATHPKRTESSRTPLWVPEWPGLNEGAGGEHWIEKYFHLGICRMYSLTQYADLTMHSLLSNIIRFIGAHKWHVTDVRQKSTVFSVPICMKFTIFNNITCRPPIPNFAPTKK
jgi:hypothetical protein